MSTAAEEALTALARDLVEEIAAGRALELAGEPVELAPHQRDLLELVSFNVRPFGRTQRVGKSGKIVHEQVSGHEENRLGGLGMEHPGGEEHFVQGQPSHMAHNISEPEWLANEWKGRQGAESVWAKSQWKPSRKAKDHSQLQGDLQETIHNLPHNRTSKAEDDYTKAYHSQYSSRPKKMPEKPPSPRYQEPEWRQVAKHLGDAQSAIMKHAAGIAQGDPDQSGPAEAYHQLAQAHEHIVSHIVPYARPENYPDIAQHLQRIAGHMQDLDQSLGADPEQTRKLLGSSAKEVMGHAGEARLGEEQAQAEKDADLRQQAEQFQQELVKAQASGPEAVVKLQQDWGFMPPRTGAGAVHPQLGVRHLGAAPGDTLSGQHAFVRGNYVPTVTARGLPVEEAVQRRAVVEALKRQEQQAQREEKLQVAALERKGIAPPGTYVPLTDMEYLAHLQQVDEAIRDALKKGMDTQITETLDGHGEAWKPERAAQHNDIVQGYLDWGQKVPSEGKALITGGLPGAGKSTVLAETPGFGSKDYVTISSDDIKVEMARRGMVPEVKGLAPMETGPLVHEESSHIANLVARALMAQRKNIAWDITMWTQESTQRRIDELVKAGYQPPHAVFVDIPAEMSARRVAARHRQGLEKYRQGTDPLGGRFISTDSLKAAEAEPGVSVSKRTFQALRSSFGSWEMWDNSGKKPVLAGRSALAQPPAAGIPSVEALQKAVRTTGEAPRAPPAAPVPVTGMEVHDVIGRTASQEAQNALYQYSHNAFYDLNNALQALGGSGPLNAGELTGAGGDEGLLKGLDSAFTDATPLSRPIIVYRGITGRNVEAYKNLKPGDVVDHPAFVSASSDPQAMAVRSGERNGSVWDITVPVGSKVVSVLNAREDRNITLKGIDPEGAKRLKQWDEDKEVLLNRDSKFRVTGVDGNHIALEYVGATESQARAAELGMRPGGYQSHEGAGFGPNDLD